MEDGKIIDRSPNLAPDPTEEVLDLSGKVIIPGLVCCHTRLARALLRGRLGADREGSFLRRSERLWRGERALDLDGVEVAGAIGGMEALSSGTTTLFDQHSSPGSVQGPLARLARGIDAVGVRAVLSYEVSDRDGAVGREEAIDENVSFHRNAKGRFRGMIGAHASFTLSPDAMEGLQGAVKETGAGLHIQIAEDPTDEKLSRERFGNGPVARLLKYGLLDSNSIAAHVVHLSWPELSQVIATGAWIAHNPRSNMQSQVGYAPAGKFGSRAVLGCDFMVPDVFIEAQIAHLRAREAGLEIDALKYLANGHRLASQVFGAPFGSLRPGGVADLVVLNHRFLAPITAAEIAGQLLSRWSSRSVEAVMIDGVWRLRAGRHVGTDVESLHAKAAEVTSAVQSRMTQLT